MIHVHIDRYHMPDATDLELRTARCGLVLPAERTQQGRDRLYTASEISRREDLASWDESGHEMRLWLSRLCPTCCPYARDPELIAELMGDSA